MIEKREMPPATPWLYSDDVVKLSQLSCKYEDTAGVSPCRTPCNIPACRSSQSSLLRNLKTRWKWSEVRYQRASQTSRPVEKLRGTDHQPWCRERVYSQHIRRHPSSAPDSRNRYREHGYLGAFQHCEYMY